MGYYTRHELEIVKGDDGVTDYKEEITEISGYTYLFGDECKWYEHEGRIRRNTLTHCSS
jgi:hypothetical protein